jgi:ParB family chromosome partitioning protein
LKIGDGERRQVDDDPIRKAKRAKFLAEYWGVRKGSAGKVGLEGNNFPPKTLVDVANTVGEDVRTVKNLLKLNDLISPLQSLVSQNKLSQTAAHSLAFLPPEEKAAISHFGEWQTRKSAADVADAVGTVFLRQGGKGVR